jgi:hypothetical protein
MSRALSETQLFMPPPLPHTKSLLIPILHLNFTCCLPSLFILSLPQLSASRYLSSPLPYCGIKRKMTATCPAAVVGPEAERPLGNVLAPDTNPPFSYLQTQPLAPDTHPPGLAQASVGSSILPHVSAHRSTHFSPRQEVARTVWQTPTTAPVSTPSFTCRSPSPTGGRSSNRAPEILVHAFCKKRRLHNFATRKGLGQEV